jgi:hypothetical protein
VPQPKAIVEQIAFGGDGTLVVPDVTVSLNGVILQPPPSVGDYTFGDGCAGTVASTGGPSFDIYMSPRGDRGWMIQTNPNTVFQGTVTRVSVELVPLDWLTDGRAGLPRTRRSRPRALTHLT